MDVLCLCDSDVLAYFCWGCVPKKEVNMTSQHQKSVINSWKDKTTKMRKKKNRFITDRKKVVMFIGLTKERKEAVPPSNLSAEPKMKGGKAIHPTKTIRQQQIKCVGFPNPSQFCYMNSCLQSLLTLTDFTRSISRQELFWNCVPEAAALSRSFMDIKGSHFSGDFQHKLSLICKFKDSILSPEFQDDEQKDAHEFLVCMLEQMRSSSSLLQSMAASYRCPVQDHMEFDMLNTRTCKSCGKGSTRVEKFTNLSLDLVPGGNVEQMLEEYEKEKELEYTCECGATSSCRRSTFLTTPKVLLLHLKRFRVTPSFELEKLHDPVDLQRNLVLASNQADYCYSLVSIISHFGYTVAWGHYICDGVDPDVGQEDTTDRWFTYDDGDVIETRDDYVCDQRKNTAYILFYKRQDEMPGR